MQEQKIGSADEDTGGAMAPRREPPSSAVLINIRVPRALRERFKAAAAGDGRTMSAALRLMVERYLRERGHE